MQIVEVDAARGVEEESQTKYRGFTESREKEGRASVMESAKRRRKRQGRMGMWIWGLT